MTTAFQQQIQRWGPDADDTAVSPPEARRYCRDLARAHYENFPVVSWLLPRQLHQHFYNVYAYCRWADDLGDELPTADESLRLLQWWREQLNDCYAGRTRHPVFVALAETIRECDIPPQPFADLISAFEQDQRITRYETFDQLHDYCRRSADPVGRLVLHMCGEYSDTNARWSDSICTGLQLANVRGGGARVLVLGRIYLPAEDRRRFGYSDADLAQRITNPAFFDLMRFEVDRARQFLMAGWPLVGQLPFRLQLDVELFARGGLRILERIEQIGYRVWDTRPVVTRGDVARLFLRSCCGAWGRRLGFRRPPRVPDIPRDARSESVQS